MDVRRVLPRDAIPSIDEPGFSSEYDGSDEDMVIVVETTGSARAYPVRIMNRHEIANDVVADRPIAVTWCPLCGSGVVYRRTIDGRTLTFGVSGKLADDDLVMYDRETESEWKQSTGRCFTGDQEGTELAVLPSNMLAFGEFRRRYPGGQVLVSPGGTRLVPRSRDGQRTIVEQEIDYATDPFADYLATTEFDEHSGGPGVSRDWDRMDLPPKETVLGLELGGEAIGVPRFVVHAKDGVARLTVGGHAVIVCATETGMQAFRDPGFDVAASDAGIRGDGTTWDPLTGRSDDGRQLEPVPSRRLFAFAWEDDHGPDAFYLGDA